MMKKEIIFNEKINTIDYKNISLNLEPSQIKLNELNQFKYALDCSSIVSIVDKNGIILYVNDRFCNISQYSRDELVGKNHKILRSNYHTSEFHKGISQTICNGHVWRGDLNNKAKDGSFYWTETVITPLVDLDGKPEKFIFIRTDITNRKIQEEQIRMIQREITKRKKDLELKNKVLDKKLLTITKLEKEKEEFTSMMTHEFKTPLTPILSWAELLASEVLGDMNEKQLKAVGKINVSALKLLHLITDVLDVHKLELSQLTYNKTKCNSKELVEDLIENYSVVLNDKSIKFIYSDFESIPLFTDSSRLQQVIRIFITNALDFVPKENPTIELKVETKDNFIIFSVIDNGIGISEIDQKQLFQKFYQVDTSATRKHGGTGLGLSVAKGITEGLGGSIGVTSVLNRGSTFFVKLPLNVEIIAQQ